MNEECGALVVRADADKATIELSGELDLATANLLTSAVGQMRDSGTTVITLDVASLTFVDSSGLSALLQAKVAAPIRLVNSSEQLRRLLEITSTTGQFD